MKDDTLDIATSSIIGVAGAIVQLVALLHDKGALDIAEYTERLDVLSRGFRESDDDRRAASIVDAITNSLRIAIK